MALLGQKAHTAGGTARYTIDYTRWLEEGVSLTGVPTITNLTATVTDIVISAITLLAEHNRVAFTLAGGSVNETFTLQVSSSDTRSEVKIDTMGFTVVAP
jgi:hypothetical protein